MGRDQIPQDSGEKGDLARTQGHLQTKCPWGASSKMANSSMRERRAWSSAGTKDMPSLGGLGLLPLPTFSSHPRYTNRPWERGAPRQGRATRLEPHAPPVGKSDPGLAHRGFRVCGSWTRYGSDLPRTRGRGALARGPALCTQRSFPCSALPWPLQLASPTARATSDAASSEKPPRPFRLSWLPHCTPPWRSERHCSQRDGCPTCAPGLLGVPKALSGIPPGESCFHFRAKTLRLALTAFLPSKQHSQKPGRGADRRQWLLLRQTSS